MADEKLTAATRIEKLLDNIAGGDNEVTPATRLEKFLSYIADAMEGGGGSGGGGSTGCNCLIYDITPSAEDIKTYFWDGSEWSIQVNPNAVVSDSVDSNSVVLLRSPDGTIYLPVEFMEYPITGHEAPETASNGGYYYTGTKNSFVYYSSAYLGDSSTMTVLFGLDLDTDFTYVQGEFG